MFTLSGILNPVLHYGGSTLWVIEDATSSSLFRFNTDDKQFVIGATVCSRSMITRAGKSDFPALMMTNWKLMITASGEKPAGLHLQ